MPAGHRMARRPAWLTRFPSLAMLVAITLLGRAAFDLYRWYVTPAPVAAPMLPCSAGHHCFALPHVVLAIPDAYLPPMSFTPRALGAVPSNGSAAFWFWIPDGAPAGGTAQGNFFMWPGIGRQPPESQPRTLVMVGFSVGDNHGRDRCCGPDEEIMNRVHQNEYDLKTHSRMAIPQDLEVPAKAVLTGTTDTIQDVSMIDHFGPTRMVFGRAGCDGRSCDAHFHFRRPLHVPYLPYRVSDGEYEIKRLGFGAHVIFIDLDDRRTLAMTQTITRLVEGWSGKR